MQKTILIGRVGGEARIVQLQTTQVINFSLCHSDKFKDRDGVQREKSQWWECSYFTDKVNIAQYIKRGGELYVEGFADAKVYSPNNGGEPQAKLTMRVHSIQLLGGPQNSNQQPQQEKAQPVSTGGTDVAQDPDESSLPF